VRIVEITSSARLPPSAVCFKESLNYFEDKRCVIHGAGFTYCIYEEINLFIKAPMMPIQGRMDVIANAKRQERT